MRYQQTDKGLILLGRRILDTVYSLLRHSQDPLLYLRQGCQPELPESVSPRALLPAISSHNFLDVTFPISNSSMYFPAQGKLLLVSLLPEKKLKQLLQF